MNLSSASASSLEGYKILSSETDFKVHLKEENLKRVTSVRFYYYLTIHKLKSKLWVI